MAPGAEVEFHGPAGFWGKFSGISGDQLMHFIIIVMLGIVIALIITNDRDRDMQMSSLMQSQQNILNNQTAILAQLKRDSMETAAITYVLTLDEKERKALRLTMPESLRGRAQTSYGFTRP